jgi:PAS domain S-box-containing protein
MVVLTGIIWMFYAVQAKNALALLKTTERDALQLAVQTSLTEFANVSSDLLYLTDQYALLDDQGAPLPLTYRALAARFISFTGHKRMYEHIRLVDERGRIVVGVDWNSGRPENVAPERMEAPLDPELVAHVLSLNVGEVHVSPIELHQDEKIGYIPIIRFATSISDATGHPRGMLVLDYRADKFLRLLHEVAEVNHPLGQIWLVDGAGYWLLGPDEFEGWEFALGERADKQLGNRDAAAWAAMRRSPSGGQIRTAYGLYTFRPLSPMVGPESGRHAEHWTVIAHHPSDVLDAQNAALLKRLMPITAALALVLTLTVLGMAHFSVRRDWAEASVRASEARFRSLLESAPDGIVIVDRKGRMVLVNAQAEQYFGYTREEMLGWPVELLVPDGLQTQHVAHREGYASNPYTRPMGEGMELYGQRKDGTRFPLEISLSPLQTPQGTVITAIIRDISGRKQAEREREEAQTRYRELMDNLPVGVYRRTPGPEGRFLEVNPALVSMFEAESAEALLQGPGSAFAPATGHLLLTDQDGPLDTVVSEEVELRTLRGRPFWAAISARLRHDPNGRSYYDGIVEDVTLRKQIERELNRRSLELEAINHELEAFSYSVSHDLRAPLRAIDGFSRLLLDDYAERLDEVGRDRLNRVRRAAQNMGTLIDDLLKLSRVTRTEIKRETVDLSALAEEVAEELHRQAPEREGRFEIEPGLQAQGDRGLLRIVLNNLLGNAWKFTGEVARAHIGFGRLADTRVATFFVSDNGAGFDMAYADKLFGVFQRLHAATEFPGTGIGLATVQRIIHKHGGRIWAESEVGKGARFFFTLEPEEPT